MAGQSHGFDNTVAIGKESSFAQKASSYNWVGIVDNFSPSESNNVDVKRSLGVRAPFMLRQGAKEVDGSLSVALQNARLIAFALGNVSTVDAAGVYTHTITPAQAGDELPSLTVHNHNALLGFTRNYVGGKVDTLTIAASANDSVSMEADILFSHVEEGTTQEVVTPELDNYYMFYEGSVKINNQNVSDITEFEIEIANGLDRRWTLNGQNRPARIEEGSLDITASMTMDFTNKDLWDNFQNGANLEAELVLQDSANPERSVTIILSGGLYDSNAIEVGAEDLQEQELEAIFTDIEVIAVDSTATLL